MHVLSTQNRPDWAKSVVGNVCGKPWQWKGNRTMAKVEKSISINAPVAKVFAYVGDPRTAPEFVPSIVEVKDVTGEGVGQYYRWTYKMIGMRFQGESTITEYVPDTKVVHKSKGGIASTWTWTFEPENGGTKVNLTVEYTIPVPVLGKFAEMLVLRQNEREADLGMASLKARLEA